MLISCFLNSSQRIMYHLNSNNDTATTPPLGASFCSFDFDAISSLQVRLEHTFSPQR